jgi:hypothetical protein
MTKYLLNFNNVRFVLSPFGFITPVEKFISCAYKNPQNAGLKIIPCSLQAAKESWHKGNTPSPVGVENLMIPFSLQKQIVAKVLQPLTATKKIECHENWTQLRPIVCM